jgi:hypothetical protein
LDLNTCWLEAAQAKVGRLAAGGIMRMVDEATGFRAHCLAELRQLLARRKQLKRRWNIVTGESIPAEGEDELIAAIDREAPPAPCSPL